MSNNIFEQCTFFLSQVTSKPTISKIIKDNGGSIVFMLTNKVTHFVTNDKEFQLSPYNVKKALGFENTFVVSEEFINESVKEGKKLEESNFTFTANPKPKQFSFFDSPAKSSPIKSESSSSYSSIPLSSFSSLAISNESEKPSSSLISKPSSDPKKRTRRVETTSYTKPLETSVTVPSPFSSVFKKEIEIKKNPNKVSAKLYDLNAKDQPDFNSNSFEVLLYRTLQFSSFSGSSSNNKFYYLEIQKDINSIHRVYTSYGRSDGKKTNEVRYAKDLEEAIDIFSTIYNEKTSDKKGYKEVSLSSSSVSSKSESASFLINSSSNSTLQPAITKLIEHLYSEATTQLSNSNTVKITERGLETPLGVLSLDQIEKGEKVLYKIKDLINNVSKVGGDYQTLSSEFYTCIPHSMGRGKSATDAVIKTLSQLNMKFELLQLMKDLLVIKDAGSTLGSGTSASDMKYFALKNKISVLSSFDQDSVTIKKMAAETKGVKILNIYRLDREGETSSINLSPSPTKLLLHGSRPSNIVGILSRGMLLPKVITETGVANRTDFGFLGYGIYYGSGFDTTCKYAHPSLTGGDSKRYAIVSRVALGRTKEFTQINSKLTEPPTGFDSCLGLKNTTTQKSDFHDDEYVIYDSKRQRQEYLVEFTYDGSNKGDAPSTFATSSFSTSLSTPSFVTPKTTQTPISKSPSPLHVATSQPPLIKTTKTPTSFISDFEKLSVSVGNEESQEYESKEDEYRKMFVNDRNNPKLSNKFLNCEKVFESVKSKSPEKPIDANYIMGYNMTKKEFVSSQSEFDKQWNKFSNNFFQGFNWNNVFVAGGSVLGCSLANQDPLYYTKSDIDIFLYGISESEANRKLDEIEQFIKNKSPRSQMARTKYAVTFLNDSPFRNIQIILRIYKTPAEVLMGFDIDCCSIGYDGSNVYAIPRAINSITQGYNTVAMSRRSLTYEARLFKYALRGFAIKVPGLKRSSIPSSAYNNDIKGSSGLLKLLLLEHKYTVNKGAIQFFMNNSGSDYNSIDIPNGPCLTVSGAVSYINYKEKSQFFAKKKEGFKHCHLVVVGEHAKEGKANWCKKCKEGQKPQESKSQDVVVGPIQWVTENPGSQLLTGSFHPVDDNKWFNITESTKTISHYKELILLNQDVSDIPDFSPKNGLSSKLAIDSNHLLCIAASYGSNVSMKSMMPVYKQYINTPDEFSYYPIHYAVKSGNMECINILLENNCCVPVRSGDYGLTAANIAHWFGASKEYNLLYSKCPRIVNVKSRAYSFKSLKKWISFPSVHSVQPSPTSTILEAKPENIWSAILDGNVTVVSNILSLPTFKETTDPLGNSFFHYAILSSLPKEMFTLLKNKGYDTNRSNIFNQTYLDFAKAISGNIRTWVRTPTNFMGLPNFVKLTPLYLVKQIEELAKKATHQPIPSSSIPIEYILNFSKQPTPNIPTGLTNFSSVVNNNNVLPPMPTFGFGGKFAPQPSQIKPATKYGFGSNNNNQIPLSDFVMVPNSPTLSPTGLRMHSIPNPSQLQSQLIGKSTEQISLALSTPKNVDIHSKEFLESSRVAQILVLIELLKSRFTANEILTIKRLLLELHLPVFNCFEAYLLNQNLDSLIQNLHLVLEVSKQ
ncbi:hypothetical protein DICPUDRAFT_150657 [Dictyostelium purpureum]|uniref:Poly [ADP-ribose] polymerase n=1 Tax=Dictyostelium purpureum TaxID=5786 RepID=F0ZGW9_DICPU|nr:uncharacterized protein DICPUDRAFT_150657 [Dictyostelium purpureum]EGC36806.1 hypothetical protein DICPUDRAFT_150657 [Dictyostelium purpureum]|eukprot:XP_003286677.1 hypothetical protein DICPUDRAFT_150657 [Dictyostelium purpureum]